VQLYRHSLVIALNMMGTEKCASAAACLDFHFQALCLSLLGRCKQFSKSLTLKIALLAGSDGDRRVTSAGSATCTTGRRRWRWVSTPPSPRRTRGSPRTGACTFMILCIHKRVISHALDEV
jgi:hypothetical protein